MICAYFHNGSLSLSLSFSLSLSLYIQTYIFMYKHSHHIHISYEIIYIYIYRERDVNKYINIFFVVICTIQRKWLCQTVMARTAMWVEVRNSLIRAIGEGAKMAGVPRKIDFAAIKSEPVWLDVKVIRKCFGRKGCISTDIAKHTSLDCFIISCI